MLETLEKLQFFGDIKPFSYMFSIFECLLMFGSVAVFTGRNALVAQIGAAEGVFVLITHLPADLPDRQTALSQQLLGLFHTKPADIVIEVEAHCRFESGGYR